MTFANTSDSLSGLPFLRSIGLAVTLRCQVTCPHCIVEASPTRTEQIPRERAVEWIDEIAAFRNGFVKVLSLTGGEPFIDLDYLSFVSSYAERKGLSVSVVTNAFWAETIDTALSVLDSLPSVKMIALSADRYHQQSIPLERVRNACLAAKTLGRLYSIALCTESEGSESFKELYEGVLEFAEKDRVYTAITQPAGRASELGLPGAIGTTPDCPPGACPGASIPMIFPDGRVTACIGPAITLKDNHPLLLGNLNEGPLAEILDEADENTVLHVIRVWGPKKLMALLREFDSKIQLPREFLKGSICDACHQMLRNEESRAALQELNRNARLREKMNYARIYYLGEYSPKVTQMNR